MENWSKRLLGFVSRWYVIVALAVAALPLVAHLIWFVDIDANTKVRRDVWVWGDAVNALEALHTQFPVPADWRRDTVESSDRLFWLLIADKSVTYLQQYFVAGLVVGYVGYSLDAGYKWLRKRRQQSKKQVGT